MDRKKGRGMGYSGFNMAPSGSRRPISGPSTFAKSDETSSTGRNVNWGAESLSYGRKRILDDDDEGLFDDEQPSTCPPTDDYQPAPGSPGNDDDDDDPLDSFMADIEVQARRDKERCEKNEQLQVESQTSVGAIGGKTSKLGRTDLDEDDQESYFKWIEDHPEKLQDEEDIIDYDAEGNPILAKKHIDPLPAVDHTTIEYENFERNFYIEHESIACLSEAEIDNLRKTLDIKVSGANPPKPVTSFAHFGFDDSLMAIIRKSEFTQPTPIQAQAIPAVLSGRDVIGIAKTGSGKTGTYLWPAISHIMDQRHLKTGEGPICLVCVPTRELAIQVYGEAKKLGKAYDIKTVCAYGGGSKWEQTKALQDGAEIVICTPGRLIDHVKSGATNLVRVTYLVFDEADRMFDLGFEPQVRSIANHVRPDRQCLMFSATFKKRVEKLARDALIDPIKIIQGELGEANTDITQSVEIFAHGADKWPYLNQRLVGFCALGKVLVFVTRKQNAEELAQNLKSRDFNLGLLHGDMQQYERNEVIQQFRNKDTMPILVATDVAARGLDIPSIKTVINYDVARDLDTHIHRIGRTGRAGTRGYAITFVTSKDKEFAGHLVRSLENVNQPVPDKLLELANESAWFRKSRFRQGKGKKQVGGRGLGYTEHDQTSQGLPLKTPMAPASIPAVKVGVKEALMAMKPGGDRLSAMKMSFSAQFKSKFHAASAETSWDSHSLPVTEPTPEWKQTMEEVRRRAQAGAPSNASSNSDNSKRKRSRWD